MNQVDERDKLKLKVVVLHDGIGKDVHLTQFGSLLKIYSQLLELGRARLNKLRMA